MLQHSNWIRFYGAHWESVCQSPLGVRHRNRIGDLLWVALSLILFAGPSAWAQAAAEYGGVVSSMGSAGASVGSAVGSAVANTANATDVPSATSGTADKTVFAAPARPNPRTHLSRRITRSVSSEEENRRALEQDAGEDAGKLLLRSTPTNASVWIEGKRVGSTPLLLVLAPGAYAVELRGLRMEFAEQRVDLQPRETREVAIPLEQRYPSQVRLR